MTGGWAPGYTPARHTLHQSSNFSSHRSCRHLPRTHCLNPGRNTNPGHLFFNADYRLLSDNKKIFQSRIPEQFLKYLRFSALFLCSDESSFEEVPGRWPDSLSPPGANHFLTMETKELETMLTYVETFFKQSGAHDLDHVLRVTHLCEEIGVAENADMRVLIPAALFHDVARPQEKETGIPHQEEGARIAEKYLREEGYDAERIPAIVHAIRTHRFSTGPEPETLEAQILSDADKLDAMGAVGIARTFMQAGEHGDGIGDAVSHIHEKLLNLRGLMYTDGAREIAKRRHAFLERFVNCLEDEIGSGTISFGEIPVQSGRTI